MIDRGAVERPAQRPVHHIIAFGLVSPANVLDGDDIAGADELGVHRRQDVLGQRAGRALGRLARRIGRAVEHDRRPGDALGEDQHGVQAGAVAHRDHRLAAGVVIGRRGKDRPRRLSRRRYLRSREVTRDIAARLNRRLDSDARGERRRQRERGSQYQRKLPQPHGRSLRRTRKARHASEADRRARVELEVGGVAGQAQIGADVELKVIGHGIGEGARRARPA